MTTPEQRAVWAALAAVATPGEWTATSSTVHRDAIPADSFVGHVAICGFGEQADADAAFIAAARTAVPALLADVDALTQERDALAAELERVRGELATGKPQPTQRENDDAAARIKRIDELWERYGLGGCYNVADWPEYAQHEYERLDTAQREYEAKYC